MIEKKGSGSNFVESKYLLEENLTLLYDEGILCERPNDRKKKYDLTKGDLYVIDPAIQQLKVGLGWDASSRGKDIDVDASVIILNKQGDRYRQETVVSYANLRYGSAVVHAGDNRTGLIITPFVYFVSFPHFGDTNIFGVHLKRYMLCTLFVSLSFSISLY